MCHVNIPRDVNGIAEGTGSEAAMKEFDNVMEDIIQGQWALYLFHGSSSYEIRKSLHLHVYPSLSF